MPKPNNKQSSEEVAISVSNLSKYFSPSAGQKSIKQGFVSVFRKEQKFNSTGYWALRDIDFKVKKGEFFGIVGRNGSGKSTLLKMMAGVYTPTKGSVEVKGKLVPFIELGVGFSPELSGRDNLFLNGAMLGFSRQEMAEMYKEIVDFAELEEHMDVKLKNFSSGMQVRLAFSIAIRAKADILLIDEVLAVGDMAFQQKCFEYFRLIKGSGKTVVFVSHDMGSVQRFCDRAALIEGSRLIAIGDTKDIVLEYGALMNREVYAETKSHDTTHKGTGQLVIGSCRVLNDKGGNSIYFGDNIEAVIPYLAKADVNNAVLGIAINELQTGATVMGPNTKESDFKIELISKGKGIFSAKIQNNNLAPGEYSLTVGIFNEDVTTAYDYVEHVTKFKILGVPRNGYVYSEPIWSVQTR